MDNPILILIDESETLDSPMDHAEFVDLSRDTDEVDGNELSSSLDHRATSDNSTTPYPAESACPQNEIIKREHDNVIEGGDKGESYYLPSKKIRHEERLASTEEEETVNSLSPTAESNAKEQETTLTKSKNIETASCLPPTAAAAKSNETFLQSTIHSSDYDQEFLSRLDLSAIPPDVEHLPILTSRELAELELAIQIEKPPAKAEWPSDWSGSLDMLYTDILLDKDRISENPQGKRKTMSFIECVARNTKDKDDFRGIRLLFSFVYHMDGTPPMAQKILAYSLQRFANTIEERRRFIEEAMRRISYDPIVLSQDGWTTKKSDHPQGPSGGAYLIGRVIIWKKFEAIIIAFVRDEDRDLWKAIWTDDNETFDLEADELQEALKAWEKRVSREKRVPDTANSSTISNGQLREKKTSTHEASLNFWVEGAEYGIILAVPPDSPKTSRISWPARILHMKELKTSSSQGFVRRNSSRATVQIVFLAPYWNGNKTTSKGKEALNGHHEAEAIRNDAFSYGIHFEYAVVEASENTIFQYPYDCTNDVLSIDKLRAAFSFTRLPKTAFPRYLDSHRLAMALRRYACLHLRKSSATTSLTDCHPMSIRAPDFPSVVLNLPYNYILSQLPHPSDMASRLPNEDEHESTEHILNIKLILESMCPPLCWNIERNNTNLGGVYKNISSPIKSPRLQRKGDLISTTLSGERTIDINQFTQDVFFLNLIKDDTCTTPELEIIREQMTYLLTQLNQLSHNPSVLQKHDAVGSFLLKCLDVKVGRFHLFLNQFYLFKTYCSYCHRT